MVREEEVLSALDPNGGSARARFVWDLAYRRGARTLSVSLRQTIPRLLVLPSLKPISVLVRLLDSLNIFNLLCRDSLALFSAPDEIFLLFIT